MNHDPLSDVFNIIQNAESAGKSSCIVPASNIAKSILVVMQEHKYIGNFELMDVGKGGKFKIELIGRINVCNSVKPMFSVKTDEFIKFEKRFLPGENVGMLIITTSKGVMDQKKAKEINEGGKLLGFVY